MEALVKNPFLVKGHRLQVIARTAKKEKVSKWENYWYYVIPDTDWYMGGCEEATGWVFGEFVTFVAPKAKKQ